MTNLNDKPKKKKIRINNGAFNQDKTRKGGVGSAATLSRDDTGVLHANRDANFGGVTDKTIREDRAAKAGQGDGSFHGAPAPHVGGDIDESGAIAKGTSSKKLMIKAVKNAKRTSASPQAKKAAIRALRGR